MNEWKVIPYKGDKPEWKATNPPYPTTYLAGCMGMAIRAVMTFGIPLLIIIGLCVIYAFITTPTADRPEWLLFFTGR